MVPLTSARSSPRVGRSLERVASRIELRRALARVLLERAQHLSEARRGERRPAGGAARDGGGPPTRAASGARSRPARGRARPPRRPAPDRDAGWSRARSAARPRAQPQRGGERLVGLPLLLRPATATAGGHHDERREPGQRGQLARPAEPRLHQLSSERGEDGDEQRREEREQRVLHGLRRRRRLGGLGPFGDLDARARAGLADAELVAAGTQRVELGGRGAARLQPGERTLDLAASLCEAPALGVAAAVDERLGDAVRDRRRTLGVCRRAPGSR